MLRDRRDGVTRIIGEGNHPSITENGRHLLFTAGRVDGVADTDVNGDRTDIYVTDLQGGQARRVSVGLKGVDASAHGERSPELPAATAGMWHSRSRRQGPRQARARPTGLRARHRAPYHQARRRWMGSVDQRRRTLRLIRRYRERAAAHFSGGPAHRRDPRHHEERAARPRERRERQAEDVVGRPIRGVSIGGQRSGGRGRFQSAVGRVRLRPHDGRDDARQRRCRRRVDGVERRSVDRRDADRSSPSRRATRPMPPTSATTSICTSPRLDINTAARSTRSTRRTIFTFRLHTLHLLLVDVLLSLLSRHSSISQPAPGLASSRAQIPDVRSPPRSRRHVREHHAEIDARFDVLSG